jgi:hypothetical protein
MLPPSAIKPQSFCDRKKTPCVVDQDVDLVPRPYSLEPQAELLDESVERRDGADVEPFLLSSMAVHLPIPRLAPAFAISGLEGGGDGLEALDDVDPLRALSLALAAADAVGRLP